MGLSISVGPTTSQPPDEFRCCKVGVRLGRGIIRRNKAVCRFTSDEEFRTRIRRYRCAPVSWYPFVSNNGKLRNVRHTVILPFVAVRSALSCLPRCPPIPTARHPPSFHF